jgi:hypothetical protein
MSFDVSGLMAKSMVNTAAERDECVCLLLRKPGVGT